VSQTVPYPEHRWEPKTAPAVRDGRGPERVAVDQPDPDYKTRPAGFTAKLHADAEPDVWEGDQA